MKILNAQCSMLNECLNGQWANTFNQCCIVNSLKIACPALNPERSSLQSDYGASRFSVGDNCKLIIVSGGGVYGS